MEPNDQLADDLLLVARLTARRAVDQNDCWIWLGARTSKGYGQIRLEGRTQYIHRLAATLFLGLDNDGDLYVLHHCDNSSCFNPDHLWLGTHAENIADAARKGRMGKKLTPEDVWEIRRKLKLGETQAKLADDFGVSKATIGHIGRRETWTHLREPN
jgi:HNH endonuclease